MVGRIRILALAAALGVVAAVGVAACGEDRHGKVHFEGSPSETAGTGGTETSPTETVRTNPETVTETPTAPPTETGSNGGAAAQ
jgi:hypothetical protein